MKARSFKDGIIILLLIPFLIVVMLTSCISVIHAAAVSDRTLQSSAVDIRYFNATSKAEASIARASTTSQGNASSSLFTVDRWQEEDYSANLHPEKYLSYYSDTEDFFFQLPAASLLQCCQRFQPHRILHGQEC